MKGRRGKAPATEPDYDMPPLENMDDTSTKAGEDKASPPKQMKRLADAGTPAEMPAALRDQVRRAYVAANFESCTRETWATVRASTASAFEKNPSMKEKAPFGC